MVDVASRKTLERKSSDEVSFTESAPKYDADGGADELVPDFDKEMKVFWRDSTMTFSTGIALVDFAFDKFVSALSCDR
jgi:hypothetical protein